MIKGYLNRGGLTLFWGATSMGIYWMWRPRVRWNDPYCRQATVGPFVVRRAR